MAMNTLLRLSNAIGDFMADAPRSTWKTVVVLVAFIGCGVVVTLVVR